MACDIEANYRGAFMSRGLTAAFTVHDRFEHPVVFVKYELPADFDVPLFDSEAPAKCIFASNTSSLSIAEIAAATDRPQRVLGMHFFNPVHIMALLEIVVHESTSETTLAAAHGVAAAMGKSAIVVKDVPGFATSIYLSYHPLRYYRGEEGYQEKSIRRFQVTLER